MANIKRVELPEGVLTLDQVEKMTGLGERTVRGWLDDGKLPTFRPAGMVGKRRFVELTMLRRFAQRNGIELREGAAP